MADPGPGSARLIHGDCVEAMRELPDESVHACCTDPPYEIGFNGNEWDRQGIAYDPEMWGEVLRVLKPGGYLLSFSAARTYHRIAAAIETAGFAVVDQLMWIYGSGTPHSHDVTLTLDARAGVDREVVGEAEGFDTAVTRPGFSGAAHSTVAHARRTYDVTVPTSEQAKEWAGWGTRLKPAHEPIVVAQKPFKGAVADNLLAHGVGAINIDATRVGTDGGIRHGAKADAGRWPPNVAFAHLVDCAGYGKTGSALLCADGCPVKELAARESNAPSFFYIAKPRRREKIGGVVRNLHATVKPLGICQWLTRMVTPPAGVVLDPFAGSGTTGCAAMIEGFRFVGIERDAESFETALARISDYAFAHDRPRPSGS